MLGVLPGVIGTIQAIEAIKLLLGVGEPLIGRLLLFDALGLRFRELALRKDPDCPLCGERPTITTLIDYEEFCGVAPEGARGAAAEEDMPWGRKPSDGPPRDVSPRELAERLKQGEDLVLVDVREPHEWRSRACPARRWCRCARCAARLQELDRERTVVLYCHHGSRSLNALEFAEAVGLRPGCRTCAGASTPGRATSTRRCRATETP